VSASSADNGSASELVKAPCGDSVSIGFDARYVLDILKTMGDSVTMKLRDSQSGALFVPAADSEYKFQVVQMPVRL
jgi:DNA polymerase III sliding clamp (beta) subunit (PCNA family)